MEPLVLENREAIAELCRNHHVKRLDVFGSATTGEFDPDRSDVDFLVEFDEGLSQDPLRTYFGLQEELASLLGRKVDLVEPGGIRNRFYRRMIEKSREPLYAA